MKKFFTMSILSLIILASSSSSFAANNVSKMATEEGGRHVAHCAQMMDRGVSHCLQMEE
jgi:hypothetical protein